MSVRHTGARPKRILVFLPCFTHGGAERQGALLARYLRDRGHDVEVWGFPSLSEGAPLKSTLQSWGLVFRELPHWPRFDWSLLRPFPSIRQLVPRRFRWSSELAEFRQTLPQSRFDVVVPFTPQPCLVSVLLRRHLGAETVFWNHRGGFDPGGIRFSPFLVKALLAQSPSFVANSDIGAAFLRQTFALAPERVPVIRNAFVSDAVVDAAARDAPTAGGPVAKPLSLAHVANFFAEKDGETLLRAMALLKSHGTPCHLHLAGHFPISRVRRRLERAAAALQIQDRVTIHGALERDQVHRLLKDADIGLLSSRSEGTPNSIMEYMYWGLPVVASDVPGIRELVGEDRAEWLFAVGDHVRLAGLIERLGRDPQLRIRLGMANHERIVEVYGADRILPQWDRLIERESREPMAR